MKRYTEEYIERLLDKFMDGTSSVEEESILGEYFRTQGGREEWAEYRRMFAYFDSGMTSLPPASETPQAAKRSRKYTLIALAAAASVAALCIMLFAPAPRNEAEMQTAQAETPLLRGATAPKTSDGQAETSIAEPQKELQQNSYEQTPARQKLRVSKPKDTPKEAVELLMEAEETPNDIEEEIQEDLRRQLTEIERIHNEIAEYNSKRIMAEINAYEIANDVREENISGGDASDQTPNLIRCLRAVTMQ